MEIRLVLNGEFWDYLDFSPKQYVDARKSAIVRFAHSLPGRGLGPEAKAKIKSVYFAFESEFRGENHLFLHAVFAANDPNVYIGENNELLLKENY